ncbi:hypothetical protein CC2G_005452 [Coprinopsis cinerea AmutBmut pab1-1]|nr:hypothetical protein CC2G_005452 [Coprinopsis cinerea AmutBmut pab1-1]
MSMEGTGPSLFLPSNAQLRRPFAELFDKFSALRLTPKPNLDSRSQFESLIATQSRSHLPWTTLFPVSADRVDEITSKASEEAS